jgi:hypothetical protein
MIVTSNRNIYVLQIEKIYKMCAFSWLFINNCITMYGVGRIKIPHSLCNKEI